MTLFAISFQFKWDKSAQQAAKDGTKRARYGPLLPPAAPVERNGQRAQPSAHHRPDADVHAAVLLAVHVVLLNDNSEQQGHRVLVLNKNEQRHDAEAGHQAAESERANELVE